MDSHASIANLGSDVHEIHVNRFLAYHDEEFLQVAYRALLQRDVDPDGRARYLGMLRSGVSRKDVIFELIRSKEARAKGIHVRGLAGYGIYRRLFSLPVIGHIFTILFVMIRCRALVRDFRALHNHLYRVSRATIGSNSESI